MTNKPNTSTPSSVFLSCAYTRYLLCHCIYYRVLNMDGINFKELSTVASFLVPGIFPHHFYGGKMMEKNAWYQKRRHSSSLKFIPSILNTLYFVQREKDNVQLSNLIIINHAKGNQSRFPTDIRLGFYHKPACFCGATYLFCKIWSMKLIMSLNFCCMTNSRTLKVRLIRSI